MSTRANLVASRLCHLLQLVYPPSKAHVFVEQPTYCFDNARVMRRPDIALVWGHRFPTGVGDEELMVAPDFVAEVVSPTNRYGDLLDRVDEFLSAGVPLLWVIEPEHRWVHVYRQDGSVSLFRASDTLRDEPLLPGFEVRVADLIPAAVESQPST